jgi:WD40 repeat protein
MRRLWRRSGGTAVRQLLSVPGGRRLTALLFIAGVWFARWVIPASPAVRWECPAGQHDYFELTHDGRTILHRAQSDNDNLIFFQMPANPVRVCDADTGRQRFELYYPADVDAHLSRVSPDGSWLLVEGKDGHDACILDATDGLELVRFPGEDRSRWWVQVAPNGRELALTPPAKSEIRLWDLAAGKVRMVLPGEKRAAAYSPDGQRLATITWDDSTIWPVFRDRISVSVWNVATGRELGRHDLPAVASMDVKFSPDGRWVAALCEKLVAGRHGHETMGFESFTPETAVPGTAMLWDVTTGATLTLADFTDSSRMSGIAFSPDGQWVVLRTRAGPRFWDLRSSPPAPWGAPQIGRPTGPIPSLFPPTTAWCFRVTTLPPWMCGALPT